MALKLFITIFCYLSCALFSEEQSETVISPAPIAEEKMTPVLELPKERDDVVRLQIFLDQKHFAPGVIDGRMGTFTKLAIENYNLSLGRKRDDLQVLAEAKATVTEPYATAIVPSVASDFVDSSLPYKRSLQANRKLMSYRSYAEMMAERYHTKQSLLSDLNGSATISKLSARKAIKVPNVQPFRIEELKHGKTHKEDEKLSARSVVVDTEIKQVLIYELVVEEKKLPQPLDEDVPASAENPQPEALDSPSAELPQLQTVKKKLVASFPITPGQVRFIPKGFWNLKNSVELPTWRYDQQFLDTGVRSQNAMTIPFGPNNPVGIIWNGLTKSGIGIHGTDDPDTIGRARSAGCIRLANWDAARFPNFVRPGAVVEIR